MLKTTKQLAEDFNCNIRTIQKWCNILQFEKYDNHYVMSENDIFELSLNIRKTSGRPKIFSGVII